MLKKCKQFATIKISFNNLFQEKRSPQFIFFRFLKKKKKLEHFFHDMSLKLQDVSFSINENGLPLKLGEERSLNSSIYTLTCYWSIFSDTLGRREYAFVLCKGQNLNWLLANEKFEGNGRNLFSLVLHIYIGKTILKKSYRRQSRRTI